MSTSNMRKKFISLCLPYHNPSSNKFRVDAQGRKMEVSIDAEDMEKHFLPVYTP